MSAPLQNLIPAVRDDFLNTYTPPFRVAGDVYFVGTVPASSHLIDTGDGLILLDAGYAETLFLVLDGMEKLGFDPKNIRYLLLTHGHIDHFGAARALRELTGCQILIGKEDADYVTGKRNLSYAEELDIPLESVAFFQPDGLLSGGDELTLGYTCIRCVHTPGHTEGTKSFFFDTVHGGRTLRVGTHGGVGLNTLAADFLNKYGLPLSLRQTFRDGLQALKAEPVDVFIGNHFYQCDGPARARRILRGDADAFIDPAAWPAYLDRRTRLLDEMLADEAARQRKGESE